MHRTNHRRWTAAQLALGLVASLLALVAIPAASPAAADVGPTVTGQACAPGVGVTVVVDLQDLGGVRLGCAPGQQADGFAALTAAGFTYNEDPGALGGTICQIGRQPAAGYPTCWNQGFWSYWKSPGTTPWAYSNVGASSGPLPVGAVEGWSWTDPIPQDYVGKLPRLTVARLADHVLPPADCTAGPQLPTFDIIDDREVLPVTLADGHAVEVATVPAAADPSTATYVERTTLPLTGLSGQTRVLARRVGSECPTGPTFDATYDVRPAYAPRWNLTTDGAPSPAIDKADPAIEGWVTGHSEYTPGGNVNPSWQVPTNAYGPVDSSLVVLGDRGSITLTFAAPITDGPGYDLAAFENGFASGAADFLEVAYLEVSSDGTNFVRFDSASRRATPVAAFGTQLASELGGLPGKDLSGKGTPFDLSVLENKPEVRSGQVDLHRITHVRLKDIKGDGADLDSFGRPIYDPNPVTGSAGYDLTGVAVLHARDELAPVVAITSAPTGTVTTTADASIAYTVDDPTATVEHRLDGGAWTASPASPITLAGLSEGPHTVDVRATDPGGNRHSQSASWTTDAVAPVVAITSGPAASTPATSASIAFTVDDGSARVEQRVDGGSWTAVTPAGGPIALSGLALGEHTVDVRATDGLARVGSASRTWTVVAPTCSTPLSGAGGQDAALDWLSCELELNGDALPGFFPGSPDYGLTIDAILALSLGGRAGGPAAREAMDVVEAGIKSYVTDQDFGDGNERYAGALGKSLLVAEIQGDDPHAFGGLDLEAEVRARMVSAGPEAGRFSDLSSFGNYSNGFGQALSIMGLSYSAAGVPSQAISFLLDQQCPGGGFRGSYVDTDGCDAATEADTDYTALAIQALLSVPQHPGVEDATAKATAWLVSHQEGSGAFGGTGLTAGANANTSGLAAQALRAAGKVTAADRAAAWVRAQQLTTANAGTDGGQRDLGAIAYNPGALAVAQASGIAAQNRDQWRRSTAQAVLAFGAPAFGTAAPGSEGSVFVPIVPCRVLDTRTTGGRYASGEARTVPVAGRCGVPATATAVEASVSAVAPSGTGFLRAWPAGAEAPNATVLNYTKAQGTTNTGAIALGSAGALSAKAFTSPTHVVIDVQGYYVRSQELAAQVTGSVYVPITPCRVLDSRGHGGPYASGRTADVAVAGTGGAFATQGGRAGGCGIPAGATAVEASVSASAPTGTGFVRAWPQGAAAPTATSLNYVKGPGTTNTGALALGMGGALTVRNATSTTHLVIDVQGYFIDRDHLPAGAIGSTFVPMAPCRVLDTRATGGRYAAGESRTVTVGGSCSVPVGATAAEASTSAVSPAGNGYFRAWPAGATAPDATVLNYAKAQGTTNTGAVPLAANGKLGTRNFGGPTHVVVDVQGFFTPDR